MWCRTRTIPPTSLPFPTHPATTPRASRRSDGYLEVAFFGGGPLNADPSVTLFELFTGCYAFPDIFVWAAYRLHPAHGGLRLRDAFSNATAQRLDYGVDVSLLLTAVRKANRELTIHELGKLDPVVLGHSPRGNPRSPVYLPLKKGGPGAGNFPRAFHITDPSASKGPSASTLLHTEQNFETHYRSV